MTEEELIRGCLKYENTAQRGQLQRTLEDTERRVNQARARLQVMDVERREYELALAESKQKAGMFEQRIIESDERKVNAERELAALLGE